MFRFYISLLAFFAVSNLMATNTPSIHYSIQIPEPQTHYAKIKIKIENCDCNQLHFKMPVWTPGSYLVREFEKSVENAVSKIEGQTTVINHTDKNTWQIEGTKGKSIEFDYDVYAFEMSVRTSFIDASHAFLHNTSIFMMVDEMKNISGTLNIEMPKQWATVSTSLSSASGIYSFENYDELADSPIELGNQEELHFEVAGVPHTIALVGLGNYDRIKLTADIQKICTTMAAIIGEHPCKNYLFIVQNVESGGGGLEHKNSCCVMMNRWNWTNPEKYQSFIGLCGHEYFHLWNVKRLRPIELGPFDYSKENYTKQLWVAEGITSYYEELALYRAGFINKTAFLSKLESEINDLESRPGSKIQTLAESSSDAWVKEYRPNENSKNTNISYYSKGEVVATLLDAELLGSTGGKSGLDKLMQNLYKSFYKDKNRGFTEKELVDEASKLAGKDLNPFFQKHVYSLETPDYKNILQKIGVTVEVSKMSIRELGIATALENGRTNIKYVKRNSPAWYGGLNANDELISINGVRVNNDADMIVKHIGTPGHISAIINRTGLVSEITFDLVATENVKYMLNFSSETDEKTKITQTAWLKTNK